MKRTPMPQRKTQLRRSWFRSSRAPKPLQMRSAVARKSDRAGQPAKALVKARDQHCIRCPQPGIDIHHRQSQGAGGALKDPTRWALSRCVWLCRDCHDWVGLFPTMAEQLGLVVRHGITPCDQVPIRWHGQLVLLDDSGWVVTL